MPRPGTNPQMVYREWKPTRMNQNSEEKKERKQKQHDGFSES
jgi:hypothetical protein